MKVKLVSLGEAIRRCSLRSDRKQLCFRPSAWIGRGDERAYIVRDGIITPFGDDPPPSVPSLLNICSQTYYKPDYQVLTLDALRAEAVELATGIEV